MKYLLLSLLIGSLWSCSNKDNLIVQSPSGNLKLTITNKDNKVFYEITSKTDSSEETVLSSSPLGLVRSDGDFTSNLSFKSATDAKEVKDSYTMVSGKQKDISYAAMESTFSFTNNTGAELQIVFRVFDEGVAFRYVFPGESDTTLSVLSELTGFALSPAAKAWMSPYESAKPWGQPGYEADYLAVKAGSPSPEKVGWAFPLLFQTGNKWVLISESGLDASYCGTHIKPEPTGGLYNIAMPEADERYGDGAVAPSSGLPWKMPWRFILVADSVNKIAESSMVYHLAEPSTVQETSWIKPGRASWEWWSGKEERTVKELNRFVDLAAEMNWEYSLIDAGWEQMADGKIEDVLAYAASKNIALLFWYNSGGRRDSTMKNEDFLMFNDDTRDQEMSRIAALGVKGVKIDFFATDKQFAIALYEKILKDAAKHKLLVNFHGCTLPRGWTRTYPHLLTMEAVKGEENYRYAGGYPDLAPSYNTMAALIRSAAGPADYTPAGFSNRKYPHKTTHAHELALTIVYETGIIHMADNPESYKALPEEAKTFLRQVPSAWDETRLLAAIPGELYVVARKKEGKWYIAGINGKKEAQTISLTLPEPIKDFTLIGDGEQPDSWSISRQAETVSSLELTLQANGGFVVY